MYAGKKLPTNNSSGNDVLSTHDEAVEGVLCNILIELKKINLQLHILTDTDIKNTEV